MDVDTAHCAFRLLSMLEAKHPLVRNLDPFTKRTIILITQASPHLKPANYATLFRTVKKDSFQKDLAFLANRLVNQTLRPLSSPPVTSLTLAEIDPLTRNKSLHSTAMAIPSLLEIRKSVRDTIDECFRNKHHNPNFTEAKILDALKQLPSDQQNQIKHLKEQLREAQEEARLYRTMSSATSNTLLSSASSAPSEAKSEHKEIKCFSCEEIGHFGEDCLCTSKHRIPRPDQRSSTARRPVPRSSTFSRGSQRVSKRTSMAFSIDPMQHLESPNLHRELSIEPFQPLYELSTTPLFQNSVPEQNKNETERHQPQSRHRDSTIATRTSQRHTSQEGVQHPPVQTIRETRMRAWDGSRRPVPMTALSAHIASIPVPVSSSTANGPSAANGPSTALVSRNNLQYSIAQFSTGTLRTVLAFPLVAQIKEHPLELMGVCLGLFFGSFVASLGKNIFRGVRGTVRALHEVTVLAFSSSKA